MRSSRSVTPSTRPNALGYITDLGHATRLAIERLRQVQTLVIETNHDEKLLQNDPHRPWPVKQRIQSRHGHLSNAAAAAVIAQLLPGKIARVVLGHLSRDCNSPELAAGTVRAELEKCGRRDIEIFCAAQSEISPGLCDRRNARGRVSADFRECIFRNHGGFTAVCDRRNADGREMLRRSQTAATKLIFVADDKMDDTGRIGDPEAIEIFPQLFHLVAPRDAVVLEMGGRALRVVGFELEPDVGMAEVWHPIDPEPDGSELENATFRLPPRSGAGQACRDKRRSSARRYDTGT